MRKDIVNTEGQAPSGYALTRTGPELPRSCPFLAPRLENEPLGKPPDDFRPAQT